MGLVRAVGDETSAGREDGGRVGGGEGGRARHLALSLDHIERLGDLTDHGCRHGGQLEEREAAAAGLVSVTGSQILRVFRRLDRADEDDPLRG